MFIKIEKRLIEVPEEGEKIFDRSRKNYFQVKVSEVDDSNFPLELELSFFCSLCSSVTVSTQKIEFLNSEKLGSYWCKGCLDEGVYSRFFLVSSNLKTLSHHGGNTKRVSGGRQKINKGASSIYSRQHGSPSRIEQYPVQKKIFEPNEPSEEYKKILVKKYEGQIPKQTSLSPPTGIPKWFKPILLLAAVITLLSLFFYVVSFLFHDEFIELSRDVNGFLHQVLRNIGLDISPPTKESIPCLPERVFSSLVFTPFNLL